MLKALAVCATYGRIPYLGRMLASFLSQTYENKHLLVINDDKNVELYCDIDNVTIINCNTRMLLRDKRNMGAVFGMYDIIFPWDDDDVYLPSRISNHIEKYSDPNVMAYRNFPSYIIYGNKFDICDGTLNSVSYRRSEWFRVGGYACIGTQGEDTELFTKLNILTEKNISNRDYVYVFGGTNYHLSTNDKIDHIAHQQLLNLDLMNGKFEIFPDYTKYNKFLTLDKLYKESNSPIPIIHLNDSDIDIA